MPAASPDLRQPAPPMPAKPYRILIVDDHAVVRRGLRNLLEGQPGIELCGEASTGAEAMHHVKRHRPDLAIMDLTMPELNGLEATRQIRQESPATDVLVLTMHFSDELAREVLRSGAIGYILKSDADKELMAAVDHARRHEPFFTSRLAATMAQNFLQAAAGLAGDQQGGAPLTGREVDVVRLLSSGKSNKEVAAALSVSTRTIESHRNHIMHKMGFGSFSDLVRYAIRSGLVEP